MKLFKAAKDIYVMCCLSPDDEPQVYSLHLLKAETVLWRVSTNVFVDGNDTLHVIDDKGLANLVEVNKDENIIS